MTKEENIERLRTAVYCKHCGLESPWAKKSHSKEGAKP